MNEIGPAEILFQGSWLERSGTVVADEATKRIYDPQTGLPIVTPSGNRAPGHPEGFRPSVVAIGGEVTFLRSHASLLGDEVDYDPETGLPILGNYFGLELVSLGTRDKWWFSTPVSSLTEDMRSPVLTLKNDGGYVVFFGVEESLIVKLLSGSETERIELPVVSEMVGVAVNHEEIFHVTWAEDHALSHGFYANGVCSTRQLSSQSAEGVKTVPGDNDRAYFVFFSPAEGHEGGDGAGDLVYRFAEAESLGNAEVVLSEEQALDDFEITLSEDGNPVVVAAVSGKIVVARRAAGSWVKEDVAETGAEVGPVSVAVGPGGAVAIAYVGDDGREIWYLGGEGGAAVRVASSEDPGHFFGVDLAFRGEGNRFCIARSSRRVPSMFTHL